MDVNEFGLREWTILNFTDLQEGRRLADKSLMVCRGEIVELWQCSPEITALARTAGCRLLFPLTGTLVVRAVVSRGRQSRENTAGFAGRFGTLSPRQTFNDLSISLRGKRQSDKQTGYQGPGLKGDRAKTWCRDDWSFIPLCAFWQWLQLLHIWVGDFNIWSQFYLAVYRNGHRLSLSSEKRTWKRKQHSC